MRTKREKRRTATATRARRIGDKDNGKNGW
jgi:hypothetical protein